MSKFLHNLRLIKDSSKQLLVKSSQRYETNVKLLSNDSSNGDLVSPSHPTSNLRLIKICEHPNESSAEKLYRIKKMNLQNWNQNYWINNNDSFQKEKLEFIRRELKESQLEEYKQSLSYDELALFYKRFLDNNHNKHIRYNFEWYKRHLSLLWPAFNAFIAKSKRKLYEQ